MNFGFMVLERHLDTFEQKKEQQKQKHVIV